MDELTQHRKKRLEQLIASAPYNGSRQAFMEKAELTKGRISQLLDPSEPFGELAAERLAEKLNLPDLRWFDQGALGAPPLWPFVLLTPEVTLTLNSRNLEIVEKLALHLLAEQKTNIVTNLQRSKLDAPKKRVPIARVKYPSQRTELDVSVIQPAGKPTRKAGRS